jgi:hypothetical protein
MSASRSCGASYTRAVRRAKGQAPPASAAQPSGLKTRWGEAGNFASFAAGRIGRRTNSPPQFGHCPFGTPSAQDRQNVHSNEQIIAAGESGGKSTSQHSQPGLSKSMSRPPIVPD